MGKNNPDETFREIFHLKFQKIYQIDQKSTAHSLLLWPVMKQKYKSPASNVKSASKKYNQKSTTTKKLDAGILQDLTSPNQDLEKSFNEVELWKKPVEPSQNESNKTNNDNETERLNSAP